MEVYWCQYLPLSIYTRYLRLRLILDFGLRISTLYGSSGVVRFNGLRANEVTLFTSARFSAGVLLCGTAVRSDWKGTIAYPVSPVSRISVRGDGFGCTPTGISCPPRDFLYGLIELSASSSLCTRPRWSIGNGMPRRRKSV